MHDKETDHGCESWPCVDDKSDRNHHNRRLILKAWENIGKETGSDGVRFLHGLLKQLSALFPSIASVVALNDTFLEWGEQQICGYSSILLLYASTTTTISTLHINCCVWSCSVWTSLTLLTDNNCLCVWPCLVWTHAHMRARASTSSYAPHRIKTSYCGVPRCVRTLLQWSLYLLHGYNDSFLDFQWCIVPAHCTGSPSLRKASCYSVAVATHWSVATVLQ